MKEKHCCIIGINVIERASAEIQCHMVASKAYGKLSASLEGGNRVAAWGSGAESDQCTTLEDLPQVFPVIVTSEGTGDFAHPHLL